MHNSLHFAPPCNDLLAGFMVYFALRVAIRNSYKHF